jgi:hypothetical protein
MLAYFRTSYLKIGDRVYAFTLRDSGIEPPPDSYGDVLTAPKAWWTLTILTGMTGYLAVDVGMSGITLATAGFAATLLAIVGHLDARERYPIARRQFVAFGLLVAASLPVFLVPPLTYVAAYWAAGGSFRLSYRGADEDTG